MTHCTLYGGKSLNQQFISNGFRCLSVVNYSPDKIIHLHKRIPWNSISLKEHVASYYFLYFLNFGHINLLSWVHSCFQNFFLALFFSIECFLYSNWSWSWPLTSYDFLYSLVFHDSKGPDNPTKEVRLWFIFPVPLKFIFISLWTIKIEFGNYLFLILRL